MGQRELYAKGGIGRWYWDFRDRAVLRHTAKAQSVLDIGCGEGITLEKVVKQNPNRRMLGIDPDPGNITGCGSLPARRGDAYNLPRSGRDCCLLLDVVEHLADPGRALRNIHQVLKPGGELLIMFPNDIMFFMARLAFLRFKAAFADYGHLWKFKPETMADILRGIGFSIQSVQRLPTALCPLHYLIVARRA